MKRRFERNLTGIIVSCIAIGMDKKILVMNERAVFATVYYRTFFTLCHNLLKQLTICMAGGGQPAVVSGGLPFALGCRAAIRPLISYRRRPRRSGPSAERAGAGMSFPKASSRLSVRRQRDGARCPVEEIPDGALLVTLSVYFCNAVFSGRISLMDLLRPFLSRCFFFTPPIFPDRYRPFSIIFTIFTTIEVRNIWFQSRDFLE